jgi:hypothetical protein
MSKTRSDFSCFPFGSLDSSLLIVVPTGCFPRGVHFTTSYRCFDLTSTLSSFRLTPLPPDFHCGSNSLSAL